MIRKPYVLTAEVGGVCVHAIEFRRAKDDCAFFRREAREAVAQHLLHILRVIAEIYRVLHTRERLVSSVLNCLTEQKRQKALNGGEGEGMLAVFETYRKPACAPKSYVVSS